MSRLIIVGPDGSGRSALAYDLGKIDTVTYRFDTIVIAQSMDEVKLLTRGEKSSIVLVIAYNQFKEDKDYCRKAMQIAYDLRGAGLKFILIANKIDETTDPPEEAKAFLNKFFPDESQFLYSALVSIGETRPIIPGHSFSEMISTYQASTQFKGLDAKDRANINQLAARAKLAQEINKDTTDKLPDALKSNTNSPSVEVSAPGGFGLKASGQVVFPLVIGVTFLLVFYTMNMIVPGIKNPLTELIAVTALVTGIMLLVIVVIMTWIGYMRSLSTQADMGKSMTQIGSSMYLTSAIT